MRSDNIFKVLGIQSREDSVSNAIAYAINQSDEFRQVFLQHICDKKVGNYYNSCRAYTRVLTGAYGIPDIVIVCKSKTSADLIIIENKLKADEGDDQTDNYATEESIEGLIERLCPEFSRKNVNASFIFLTLFPDQWPASRKFVVKRHSDLAVTYRAKKGINSLADHLISDWVGLTKSFYAKSQAKAGDLICQKLQDDDGMDGGYLYFRTFLSQLNLPNSIKIENFFRDSRQGRRYYGAVFSKENWHPKEMIENCRKWTLDEDRVFNVHLEPQFNVLNGIFSIFLHYEVNPYEPESWVLKNIPKKQYEGYLARRQKFTDALQNRKLKEWIFGGGCNQIAKVQLNFEEYSFTEAKESIEMIFKKTTIAIDSVLSAYDSKC